MEKAGQIALGRVVIGTRERILALEVRGKGILAYTIRTADEVRNPDEIFDEISDKKSPADMLTIAAKIIEQREGPFDPSDFKDRYEDALKALIDDKKKGHKPVAAEAPDDTNVVDLMAALRASLSGKGKGPPRLKPKPDTATLSIQSPERQDKSRKGAVGLSVLQQGDSAKAAVGADAHDGAGALGLGGQLLDRLAKDAGARRAEGVSDGG